MDLIVVSSKVVEFNISKLKSGVYFINTTNGNSHSLIKLVVEK